MKRRERYHPLRDVGLPTWRFDRRRLAWVVPALGIVCLLAVGLPALSDYGVTWDEALGDLFFGERYLSFFTSLDPTYLDFGADPYPPDRVPDLGRSPFRIRAWEYYPVANTLAAATSEIVSRRLGLLDRFDGFHALNLVLGSFFIVFYFRFLEARRGLIAASVATGLLLTSPRVFSHLMANIKDFPLMVLFTAAALAAFAAIEAGSARRLIVAGALWGLALGTKANALFLPFIPIVACAWGRLPATWSDRRGRLFLGAGAALALGLVVAFASWPYLWGAPLERTLEHLRYIGFRGQITRSESLAPVLPMVFLTTPPAFLALAVGGIGVALRRAWHRRPLEVFLLVWVIVVLGRFLPPQAVNFDGVRHFLELFPALAALAGLAAAWLCRRLAEGLRPPGKLGLKAALALAVVIPGAWATLRTHPFQIAYWNALAGGLDGARTRGWAQAGDYWGMSYRVGLRWLDRHAPPDALLAVPVVEHAVRLVAPLRLRSDITLLPVTTPLTPRIPPERLTLTRSAARSRPLLVMFVHREDWMNELMRDCLAHLTPIAEWQLDGAPVLSIYHYPPELATSLLRATGGLDLSHHPAPARLSLGTTAGLESTYDQGVDGGPMGPPRSEGVDTPEI